MGMVDIIWENVVFRELKPWLDLFGCRGHARLTRMLLFLVFLLGMPATVSAQGRIVQLYGRGFSFRVAEPEGWELDTGAAPQIANFIFHPRGMDWRRAEALVIARFVHPEDGQTLDGMIEKSRQEFTAACPFGEARPVQDEELTSIEPFKLEEYDCPGVRQEIVAAGSFPRYFVIFSLSSNVEHGVEAALPMFRTILSSFEWVETPVLRELPGPLPDPGDKPRNSP